MLVMILHILFVGVASGAVRTFRHAPKVAFSELRQSHKAVQDDAHAAASGHMDVSHAKQDLRSSSASTEQDAESSDVEAEMSLEQEVPKVIVESNKVSKMMEDVDDLKSRPKRTDRTVRLLVMKIGTVKKMLNHMYHHFRGAVQRAELNREMHAQFDQEIFDSSAKAVKTLGGSLTQLSNAQQASASIHLDEQVEVLDSLNSYLQTFVAQMSLHMKKGQLSNFPSKNAAFVQSDSI